MGLDEENTEIEGLDEGVLDGDVLLVGSVDGRIAAQRIDRFLQAWFVGITGMDATKFRPRWQPEPPNLPAAGADWAAFGVVATKADVFPAIRHVAEDATGGDGFDELQRNEEMDVLVSFYGPNADAYARALRENCQVAQNREVLLRAEMGLIETSDITTVPSLIKNKWLYRADITIRLRRLIRRQYRVENVVAADIELKVGTAIDGGTINEKIQITK